MCTSRMFHSTPQIMKLLKYFKCIEPLKKKEFKIFYLNQFVFGVSNAKLSNRNC